MQPIASGGIVQIAIPVQSSEGKTPDRKTPSHTPRATPAHAAARRIPPSAQWQPPPHDHPHTLQL